jgi:hypothetical protein
MSAKTSSSTARWVVGEPPASCMYVHRHACLPGSPSKQGIPHGSSQNILIACRHADVHMHVQLHAPKAIFHHLHACMSNLFLLLAMSSNFAALSVSHSCAFLSSPSPPPCCYSFLVRCVGRLPGLQVSRVTIVEKNGVKIGIIGFTTPQTVKISIPSECNSYAK